MANENPRGVDAPRRVILNPVSGERIVVLQSGDETGGEVFVFELHLPPGKHVPSRHTHPNQEESFTILEGTMQFTLGWRTIVAHAGETVVVPRGVAHWFGNPGTVESCARVRVRPALHMQEFFESVADSELGESGSPVDRVRHVPNLAQLLLQYQREVTVPDLPMWLVRPVLRALARRARNSDSADARRTFDAKS